MASALVLALAPVACGSGDSGDDGASDDEVVADCLDDAGYDGPLEDVDARRVDDADFDAAITRCYLEIGVELQEPGELTRMLDQIVVATVQCLRDRGWEVPDPVRGPGGLNLGDLGDYVPEDQMDAFLADDTACAEQIAPPGESIGPDDLPTG